MKVAKELVDSGDVNPMEIENELISNVYRAFQMYKNEGQIPGQSAKWKCEHEQIWNIVMEVNELREKYG